MLQALLYCDIPFVAGKAFNQKACAYKFQQEAD